MHTRFVLLALLTALATGCKGVDCGDGTTERNGICVPSSETVAAARCGPFTRLQGDTCVPMFPPTVCDADSTAGDTDPDTGVTTCISTGGGGCSTKLPCPVGRDGKQTICGQIYDFETGQPFEQQNATGTRCPTVCTTTTGPCSLGIRAFDAVAFVQNPGSTLPLTTDPVYLDDCGRFRISQVTQPAGPFVAIAIDDVTMGIGGTTNPSGIALSKVPNAASKDLEAFIVRGATITGWGGTPGLAGGIFAPVYRGHRTGTDLAAGVQFTFGPMSAPPPTMTDMGRDFYFAAGATSRTTLDPAANATGANGTALVSGASLGELYSGRGGLPATCMWDIHAGAAIPGVVFIQIFRPTDVPGMTCPL